MHVALIFLWALMWSAVADATSDISARYDGLYRGAAAPVPGFGAAVCPSFAIDSLRIERGLFKVSGSLDQPTFEGFITAEGFISGFFYRDRAKRQTFEGRIQDSHFSAGFIDEAAGCAWTANLTKSAE